MEALINYKGFELTVDFEYYKAEKSDLEYPGCPAYTEINKISIEEIDIYDLIAAIPDGLEDIETLCIESLSDE